MVSTDKSLLSLLLCSFLVGILSGCSSDDEEMTISGVLFSSDAEIKSVMSPDLWELNREPWPQERRVYRKVLSDQGLLSMQVVLDLFDFNRDGRADFAYVRDSQGTVTHMVMDFDLDGKPDHVFTIAQPGDSQSH